MLRMKKSSLITLYHSHRQLTCSLGIRGVSEIISPQDRKVIYCVSIKSQASILGSMLGNIKCLCD